MAPQVKAFGSGAILTIVFTGMIGVIIAQASEFPALKEKVMQHERYIEDFKREKDAIKAIQGENQRKLAEIATDIKYLIKMYDREERKK